MQMNNIETWSKILNPSEIRYRSVTLSNVFAIFILFLKQCIHFTSNFFNDVSVILETFYKPPFILHVPIY